MRHPPTQAWLTATLLAFWCVLAGAAGPINKCLIDGRVTFQNEPCPTPPAERPTVEQLNRERQRQLRDNPGAAAVRPSTPAPTPATPAATAVPASPAPAALPAEAERAPAPVARYRCDGRRYCSQMTSCEEARFFVANCPDVRMDGNRDGNPCQRQWCGR